MVSTLLALHLLASSQTPPPLVASPAPAPARVVTWYGPQTLIADGSTLLLTGAGFIAAAAGAPKPGFGIAGSGIGLSLLVAPIVHVAHGNGWGALASFGLRLLGLWGGAAGGALLAVFTLWSSATEHWEYPAIGAMAGQIIAGLIDAQRLAFESARPAPATSSLQWAPFAGSVRGAPVAGLAGMF